MKNDGVSAKIADSDHRAMSGASEHSVTELASALAMMHATLANDLDCRRAWLRKAFHRARRRNTDCVFGTAKGDTRFRGGFDLVKSFCHCGVEGKRTESTHMNPRKAIIAILANVVQFGTTDAKK